MKKNARVVFFGGGIATNEQNNETARSLIKSRIQYVVDRYYNACGLDG